MTNSSRTSVYCLLVIDNGVDPAIIYCHGGADVENNIIIFYFLLHLTRVFWQLTFSEIIASCD
jgi:acetyl esterase/lipase